MDPNWAAENLQVIRTLMERAATYRRTLAPVMITNGGIGLLASILTCFIRIERPLSFSFFWLGVGLAAFAASFLLVRRQALNNAEAFWSPPTKRVTQALMPGFLAGLVAGLTFGFNDEPRTIWLLPPLWVLLYGTALHAAGFFMTRGIKLFGWCLVILGLACLYLAKATPQLQTTEAGHYIMGFFFGVLHLIYGIYLYFTEKGKNAV
jgi:hypothetical protein